MQDLLAAVLAELAALRQELGEPASAALRARLTSLEAAARQASELVGGELAALAGECDTILVVEDGAGERRTLCKMLRQLGYRVLEAADGREAVKLYSEHQAEIALVLLDMLLPNLGGREAFRWLRRVDPTVRVLLTNGYLDQDRVQDALFEGAAGFLQKPFGPEELWQALQQGLGTRAQRVSG